MCDLWRHTLTGPTPAGAIALQVAAVRRALDASHPDVSQIKLYNASNFFDPRAVPDDDRTAVAEHMCGYSRVIVESHPSLVGSRTTKFLDALSRCQSPPALEVAMGLETAHPDALERLNKRMTVDEFAAAAARLNSLGIALRVFLLVHPPFVAAADQDEWLCRSVDFAFAAGATAISLIPTRPGNGALEALSAMGLFTQPRLDDLERSHALALRRRPPAGRVFADLWDLERFANCPDCFDARRRRLQRSNLQQSVADQVVCSVCGSAAVS